MEKPEVIRNSLAQCIGTSQYWKIFPDDFQFYITDGVKAMYEMCEALWLVSAIFFDVHKEKIRKEDFVVYKLKSIKTVRLSLSLKTGIITN